ncbi:MAG TPA: hypothetical protein VGM87_06780 [Roseomonas sp.]|jgi:hypothetical protein
MLGRGIFSSRAVPLPVEVAVHITEADDGTLMGVVVPPGGGPAGIQAGDFPAGAGLVARPAELAINDGIRKAQALQAPLVIVDPYGVWNESWGELRLH